MLVSQVNYWVLAVSEAMASPKGVFGDSRFSFDPLPLFSVMGLIKCGPVLTS